MAKRFRLILEGTHDNEDYLHRDVDQRLVPALEAALRMRGYKVQSYGPDFDVDATDVAEDPQDPDEE